MEVFHIKWASLQIVAVSVVAVYFGGGIAHVVRENVPAWEKWGHNAQYCSTSGPTVERSKNPEDPISSFSSLVFFIVALEDPPTVLYGALLGTASALFHASEDDGLRNLDYLLAASLPGFLALRRIPIAAAATVGVNMWLYYGQGVDELIIALVGLVIALVGFYFERPELYHVCGAGIALGAMVALRGGDRNTSICTNDKEGAYGYDARHGSWHIAGAILLWVGIGIYTDNPRQSPVKVALCALIPAISRLTDLHTVHFASWLTTTTLSALAFVAVAFWPKASYTKLNQSFNPL